MLASFTHLNAKLQDNKDPAVNGNRPVSVPKNVLVVGFDADVPGVDGAAVLGNLRISENQVYDISNERKIPGFAVFDAGARYTFGIAGKSLTARINVLNVFDKNYYQSTDFTAQTGDPRSIRVSLSADF